MADSAELAAILPPPEAEALWNRISQGSDAALAARAFAALGDLREAQGDRAAARAFFQQALVRQESASDKPSASIAVRLNSLALVSEPQIAVPLLQRALSINRRSWGENHPETATTEVNLSGELLAIGHIKEAIEMGELALANFEATLGDNHPRTSAAATTLADAFRANREFARAEKLYRRSLAIDEAAYGPLHSETLGDVKTLAQFLRERGRVAEANRLEQRFSGAGK